MPLKTAKTASKKASIAPTKKTKAPANPAAKVVVKVVVAAKKTVVKKTRSAGNKKTLVPAEQTKTSSRHAVKVPVIPAKPVAIKEAAAPAIVKPAKPAIFRDEILSPEITGAGGSMLVGCSGYHYKEWKGEFYPEGLPSTKWLDYYATHFNTLEINATFYRRPSLKTMTRWYKDSPAGFQFTVKANKLFTHYRRMNNIALEQEEFYGVITEGLQEKLKCILYQFPASVKYKEEMLERILTLGNFPLLHAIEFRDISWWREDVFKALQDAGLVFCNVSLPDLPDQFVPNAQVNYLRFHGTPVLYKSGYGHEGLIWWIEQLRQYPAKDLIVYFNNTWFMEAIKDARIFDQLLRE